MKLLNSPDHSVLRLRYAVSENVEHLSAVVLREEMVALRGGIGFVIILRADAAVADENSPAVVAANVLVDAIGCGACSSCIHQVDQRTSISCQRDSLLPHLCVASAKIKE